MKRLSKKDLIRNLIWKSEVDELVEDRYLFNDLVELIANHYTKREVIELLKEKRVRIYIKDFEYLNSSFNSCGSYDALCIFRDSATCYEIVRSDYDAEYDEKYVK